MDTHLFVHLNVEPIGHLIVLERQKRKIRVKERVENLEPEQVLLDEMKESLRAKSDGSLQLSLQISQIVDC